MTELLGNLSYVRLLYVAEVCDEAHYENVEGHLGLCLSGGTYSACLEPEQEFPRCPGKGIPGYLDPRTGTFTTRTQDSGVKPQATPELTGTSILFRVQFNITITNYDQPSGAQATCYAFIREEGDPNYFADWVTYPATQSGNTWTCNPPILTLWTLQHPNNDSVYACVNVDFYKVLPGLPPDVFYARESDQPCLGIPMPSNGQTVTVAQS